MSAAMTISDLRAAVARVPRYLLGHAPTPLEPLPQLSRLLGGPQIYIKRDDCTGFALGGNKTRHNEFLLADALSLEADLFVWGAGVQSNNCRQTAAACAKAGLECHLVLGRGGPATGPEELQGNLLLDHLFGAHIEIVEEAVGAALDQRIARVAQAYRERGRRVYLWDRDRVTPRAAISYALALAEIVEQIKPLQFTPTALYVSSAGSTGAGLVFGQQALGVEAEIISVAPIQWPWDTAADMAQMAEVAARLCGIELPIRREQVQVRFDHIGPAYGQLSAGCLEAISLLAREEGILLDPLYTGKAMSALIADIRAGRWRKEDHVVFIHTGGQPVLFAYHNELARGISAGRIS